MSTSNDKAGSSLPQTQIPITTPSGLIEPLSQLEDRLHNLLACHRFFGEALRLMTEPEALAPAEEWHLGLFLHQQWLQQQGDALLVALVELKQSLVI